MAIALPRPKFALPALGGLRQRLASFAPAGAQPLALGLDIGSHAVKACELRHGPAGYHLETLGSALMPPEAIDDGALVEPEAVAGVISGLLTNLKSKNRRVAISVSGYSVIVKRVTLPVMEPAELENYIHDEAEQYIPFDIDDVYLDCHDLQTNSAGEEYTDVMLVAAKKELVDGYLEMLDSLGLTTVVVDVDAFSLENAFEAAADPHENVILADIGASKMNVNILAGGASALTRDVTLGGWQLTEQIQRALDISFDEAEEIKLGRQEPADDGARERVAAIVLDTCRQWNTEISRALDKYQSGNPEYPVSRIVLSGGGARLAGLADFLARESGLPTTVFTPFAKVASDAAVIDPAYLRTVAPEMAQAFGLATRLAEF